MSRTVSTTIQTGLDAHVAQPAYLVEVLLTQPLRWSSAGALTWNGEQWLAAGMSVKVADEKGATLRIRNDDNSGSSLVLNNRLRDVEVRIYKHYNGDAVEVFRGYGGSAKLSAMYAEITLHANQSQNAKAPRGRIAAPVFTNLPKLGEVIAWGGDKIKVE